MRTLKGGEAMIFGRAGEVIAHCRAAGIAVEVVPGISSPQGAASQLVASLTHRDHAWRLQFVTACGFRFIPAGYSDLKPATVPI